MRSKGSQQYSYSKCALGAASSIHEASALEGSQLPVVSIQQVRSKGSQQYSYGKCALRVASSIHAASALQKQPVNSEQQERCSGFSQKKGGRSVRAGKVRRNSRTVNIGQTGLTQTALSPAFFFFLGGGAFWVLQSKVLRTLLRE